jgi:hypothetical protein
MIEESLFRGLKTLKEIGERDYSIYRALPNGTLRFNHLYRPDRFIIVEVVRPREHGDRRVYNILVNVQKESQ